MTLPLDYYARGLQNPLFFHLLDVGHGLMNLIIFPDSTTMLFDCNLGQDTQDHLLDYLRNHIPIRTDPETNEESQWIDIFVCSHRDTDHYRGLKAVDEEFPIRSIWDSGQTPANTQDGEYQYYMRLRRRLVERYGAEAVVIPIPSPFVFRSYGQAAVYCLLSSAEFVPERIRLMERAVIQHQRAIVLSLNYSGRSILMASDSSYDAWRDRVIPNFASTGILLTTILVASHHGSRSFFTDSALNDTIDPEKNPSTTYVDALDYLKPSITLISCGDLYNLPDPQAVELYRAHTANASHHQVYATKNKGTFAGFIGADSSWTICPSRFDPEGFGAVRIEVKCEGSYQNRPFPVNSGDSVHIGSSLEFSIVSHSGAIEPYDSIVVFWEVSNGGTGQDHEHQEIYDKGDLEHPRDKLRFEREVRYLGKHLLRCCLVNRRKSLKATRVFVVNGVTM